MKDIFVSHFDESVTSKELNDKLNLLKLDEKDMVNQGNAVFHSGYNDKKSNINNQVLLQSPERIANYL